MNVAIVHFTDIHFTEKTNIDNKISPICRAIIKDSRGVNKIYIIISGDIAYSGKSEEYAKARNFFSVLTQLIIAECPGVVFKFIIVPGNHDCNFNGFNTQLRRNVIQNVNYQTLGDDNSLIELCLSVQSSFWDFYAFYNPVPNDKMFYQINDIIDEKTVTFSCLNTSWMSQMNEQVGGIFYPSKRYESFIRPSSALNFGVWHHPYNWLNPNTAENNKKEFERFTEQLASTHFFGHEHEHSMYKMENQITGDKINLLSELLNDDKKKHLSGFQTLVVDLNSLTAILKKYQWSSGIYVTSEEKPINLALIVDRTLKVNDDFIKSLEEIKIPLIIDNKKDIKLSDIFVYPDLDYAHSDSRMFDNYINANRLLEKDSKHCLLDGEAQTGKTSLLIMFFFRLYERKLYPLFLNGKDLKELNLNKVIKKAFRQQYSTDKLQLEKFLQMEIENKVLIVDDFQDCEFNSAMTKTFYDEAILQFGKVIIMLDSASSIIPSMKAEFHDINFYNIKPLGFKKRNELIERYQLLKENPYTLNEQIFLETVKTSFDNVQSILGDKLIPSYPVFILSILQALEYKPLKQNETSFGYCYQTLIHYSLFKAGISNDQIDTYFNFLAELAYYFIVKEVETINRSEINSFYFSYQEKFLCPAYDVLYRALIQSKILYETDSEIGFGYNYILYYLSAKKISDIHNTKDGTQIVEKLFAKMHIERNANILVFITHHSKDINFIEQSLLNTMVILDKNNPITLNKNDPFYNEIFEFADQLKNDILEINRSPKEEREKMLESKDRNQRKIESSESTSKENDLEDLNNLILPFHQSFRSIEIVGQIIKNRKGSLPKSQLIEMISELYVTGFRTIAYLSDLLTSARTDVINLINEETKNSEDKRNIEKKITQFVQMVSFQACLGVFSKLTHSLGNKDLKNLYKEVAAKMDTPAAKLVSFMINSYYSSISVEEVKLLAEDLKDNLVALKILRNTVKLYVYNKNPDFVIKQKLASNLNMALASNIHSKEMSKK